MYVSDYLIIITKKKAKNASIADSGQYVENSD
jgi:hypothetical protein